MRRSQASASVEVRQVIAALCRLLGTSGLKPVPVPETFRRAKFAGGDQDDELLQLLLNILLTAGVIGPVDRTTPKGECMKLLAVGLWQTGYYADWMYRREGRGDESRRFSSRDLLLALGWLLAAGTLEKLVTQQVEKLDRALLSSVPENVQLPRALQVDSASLRRLHWLTGSLRHQGRTLLSMLRERTRVLHVVLSVSDPSTAPTSSDSNSAVLKQDCVYLRQLCDLLEAYVNWKQVEAVFWTWMDSVVDCHLEDPVVERPTHKAEGGPRLCHHENRGLQEDMLLRRPTTQEGDRSIRGGVKDREAGDGSQNRLGASSIAPLLSAPSSLCSPAQACRVRLQPERAARRSRCPAEGAPGPAEDPDHLPASQAAEMLRSTEALLLERRDRQRLANRMQIQDMIGRLEELVLIPP